MQAVAREHRSEDMIASPDGRPWAAENIIALLMMWVGRDGGPRIADPCVPR
jgi:hypothetical protein